MLKQKQQYTTVRGLNFVKEKDRYILILDNASLIYVIKPSDDEGWDVYAKKEAMEKVINRGDHPVLPCSISKMKGDINYWLNAVSLLVRIGRNPFLGKKLSIAHSYLFEETVISAMVNDPIEYNLLITELYSIYGVQEQVCLVFKDKTAVVFEEETCKVTNVFACENIDH